MATELGKDWTLAGMDNPLLIQNTLLTRFEQETGAAVVDNNNPASVLMEGFASLASSQMKMLDDTVRPAIYPARAVTTADLFKHISDYDYVDVFSAPASATIVLVVEKSYIMTHSLPVPDPDNPGQNKEYLKMTIPRSTQIHLGDHTFGLYYPIEIRSSIKSGRFSVVYADHDKNGNLATNPLKTLETNVLDFEFREWNGHKLAYIQIPVYQFKIEGRDEVLTSGTGFKRVIPYQDKFYALRVWANVLQNPGHDDTEEDVFARQELELAVSGQVYDPETPTIVFTPDEEDKEVTVELPYIYLMDGKVSGTIHIDIYTTEGELNYQVPFNTEETCVIDMFGHISPDEEDLFDATYYAEPFRPMPALRAFPTSSIINGGSNGLTFEQIRRRVIKGVNTAVLQTPDDIDAYFASYGYTATLYRDGITDRIFIVHATVVDEDGVIAGMDTIPTLFDFSKIDQYSTIVKASDSVFTVLPSTLYRFDKTKRICLPLTDIERNEIEDLPPADIVEKFNSNVFTLSPFHLQVNTANRYPTTVSYDMLQVKRLARTFIAARDAQYGLALNTVNLDVHPRAGDVADRYRMTFRVARVGFGNEVPVIETSANSQGEKKIRVLIGIKNDDGEFRWAEAQHISSENTVAGSPTNEVFELILTPNYIFHQANNEHTFQMAMWDDTAFSDFFLKTEIRILLMMKNNITIQSNSTVGDDGEVIEGQTIRFDGEQHLKAVNPDATNFNSGYLVLPTSKRVNIQSEIGFADYVCVTEQKSIVQFGSPIDELDQRINLTYSEAVYKTHKTTKFKTIENDIFELDENGNIKLDISYLPATGVYQTGVLYYTKSGNDWVQLTGYTIGNPIGENVFYRSVGATKLHKAGKVTCMTAGVEETIVPTADTRSNYLNAGIKVVDSDDSTKSHSLTEAELDEAIANGTPLAMVNAPVPPRFTFKSTSEDIASPTGKFELCDAANMKPLSSMENVWSLVGANVTDSEQKPCCKILTVNALKYVIENLAVSRDASGMLNPLAEIGGQFASNSFLVLEGDGSEVDNIQIGSLGSIPEGTTVFTRLYYKFGESRTGINEEGLWICIAQGMNIRAMLDAIEDEENDENAPKYFGFAYVMEEYSKTEGTDELTTIPCYLAFLTNTQLDYTSNSIFEEVDTTDSRTVPSQSEIYYVKDAELGYRVAKEEDFTDDGNFIRSATEPHPYYVKRVSSGVYTIPDFTKFEKLAWEKHTRLDNEASESVVLEGRTYCYKDKAASECGYTRWVIIPAGTMEVGTRLTDYIDLENDTADRKIYYTTSAVDDLDANYGWEQMGNRWPWEVTNWRYISKSGSAGAEIITLVEDPSLVVKSDYERSHRYWEYSYDQVILDEKGHPLEDYEKPRAIQYLVDMLQMDAKLGRVTTYKEDTYLGSNFGDDGVKAHKYPTTVVSVLRTHFDNVGRARDTMFTNTRLFFEPVKSLGYADFNVGNNEIRELPLDVTMKFRLHVTYDAYEDDILLENMRETIIKIIDKAVDAGYVNCVEIARSIIAETDGAVKYVDVLGIDGDPDLQTMRPVSKNVRPHLKHTLKLSTDGKTIDVDRGLELEAVVNE